MNQADEAFRKAYHARYNARCWAPSAFVSETILDGAPVLLNPRQYSPAADAVSLTAALLINLMHPRPSAYP